MTELHELLGEAQAASESAAICCEMSALPGRQPFSRDDIKRMRTIIDQAIDALIRLRSALDK